jgi:hypothetical protein
MAAQYPRSAILIQEDYNGLFLPLQGSFSAAMVQTPYAVRYTITEPGMHNPAVTLLFTRNIDDTYSLRVIEKPNGEQGEDLMQFEADVIPADSLKDKMDTIYDRYIGMGGGKRRRRRRTHKKLNKRRRRSLKHRKAK